MAAYYNEHDPYCVQWLKNLIAANLIAPGDVDGRNIQDVNADDLKGYTQCHFFAGIGGWSYALRLAGWPDDRPVWTGSCPCQPFSAAGAGKAADDERHLWPAWFSLVAKRRPAIVFGELAASGRRTSDSDCGSWPTPEAAGFGGDVNIQNTMARRARYQEKYGNNGFGLTLAQTAALAPWPTPMAGTPAQKGYNEACNTDSGRKVVALASWPTTRAADGEKNVRTWEGEQKELARKPHGADLVTVSMAAWVSPQASDGHGSGINQHTSSLDKQARSTASGPTPNGSPAQTEKPGQLDPDHSRWVMGYSAAHLSCAPTETPSSRKSRRNSSSPRAKR